MPFYCYILECADGTFYTGWTTDPPRREKQHNAGRGAKYTRARRLVKLVYVEELPDRHEKRVGDQSNGAREEEDAGGKKWTGTQVDT
jgi:predicted GIY-YIG superfamily endonuclease